MIYTKTVKWKYMWKIGNVEIKNQVVLAPMAGISNTAYRQIIKEMGAGLIYAEMVSDKAICYGSSKTFDLLKMNESERPIAQQIFGSDVNSFVEAAKKIEAVMKPDIIDINMGCPVPKVAIKNQAGSALLKNPEKIKEIVAAVVKSVSVPVTVKIRSGWDENNINAVTVAKNIEEAGASAITIHARTRSQGYSGKANWDIIKEVKECVSIPVIGNGDILSCYDAKRMLEETGCDAVMIGRASFGRPWIFKEIHDCIHKDNPITLEDTIGSKYAPMSADWKLDVLKEQVRQSISRIDEYRGILHIRRHLAATPLFKGIHNFREHRIAMLRATSINELFELMEATRPLIREQESITNNP